LLSFRKSGVAESNGVVRILIGSEEIAVSVWPQVAMHSQLPPFLVIIAIFVAIVFITNIIIIGIIILRFSLPSVSIILRDLKNSVALCKEVGIEEVGIVIKGASNPSNGGGGGDGGGGSSSSSSCYERLYHSNENVFTFNISRTNLLFCAYAVRGFRLL